MATIVCPSCATELTEYKRFCPECGTRLPEPEQPPAPPPVAPTVLLPPEAVPPPAPVVPPTTRLDAPAAPTVMLPPENAPPPATTVSSTTRLDAPAAPTVMLPPAGAQDQGEADTPTMLGGNPSPVSPLPPLPATPPPAYGGQSPATPYPTDQAPGYSGQLPAAAPYPTDQTPGRGRRTLWWLLGGGGCLILLFAGACALAVVIFLGSATTTAVETAATAETVATAETGPVGGGGIVPQDSPLTGGDVLLRDDFEDPDASGLGVDDDELSRYAYEDGAYVIEVKEPETLVWTQVEGTYNNARIELDAEVPPDADVSAAGVIFHYQDADNFYVFRVSNDGYYALDLLQDNEWIVLIDWTESDAVDGASNRMRVETSGDRIALYLNDEPLEETSDGTFTEGAVALAVSSLPDSTAEVRFDNLLIAEND